MTDKYQAGTDLGALNADKAVSLAAALLETLALSAEQVQRALVFMDAHTRLSLNVLCSALNTLANQEQKQDLFAARAEMLSHELRYASTHADYVTDALPLYQALSRLYPDYFPEDLDE